MQPCHCGSGRPYSACCAPYIHGEASPQTAEALMRSRYSAYAEHAIDYLGDTLHPDHREPVDLMPEANFAHPTLYLLISPAGTRVEKGQWWPVLNGQPVFRGPNNPGVQAPTVLR